MASAPTGAGGAFASRALETKTDAIKLEQDPQKWKSVLFENLMRGRRLELQVSRKDEKALVLIFIDYHFSKNLPLFGNML